MNDLSYQCWHSKSYSSSAVTPRSHQGSSNCLQSKGWLAVTHDQTQACVITYFHHSNCTERIAGASQLVLFGFYMTVILKAYQISKCVISTEISSWEVRLILENLKSLDFSLPYNHVMLYIKYHWPVLTSGSIPGVRKSFMRICNSLSEYFHVPACNLNILLCISGPRTNKEMISCIHDSEI